LRSLEEQQQTPYVTIKTITMVPMTLKMQHFFPYEKKFRSVKVSIEDDPALFFFFLSMPLPTPDV